MMKRLSILVVLSIILACFFFRMGEAQSKWINVTGQGTTKEQAIQDALRRAVEEGTGVLIGSETLVHNMMTIRDKIVSKSQGYVKEYNVDSAKQREDGVWESRVSAFVDTSKLEGDIMAIAILLDWLNYPRVMLLVDEVVDHGYTSAVSGETGKGKVRIQQETPSGTSTLAATTAIEEVFLSKGIEMVDAAQVRSIWVKDVAAYKNDPKKAATLARRNNAEILIIGEARSTFAETDTLYGQKYHFYDATLNLKAIQSADGVIIASTGSKAKKGDSGRQGAAYASMKLAGEQIAGKLLYQIMTKWRTQVYEEQEFQVIVTNVDNPAFIKIARLLEAKTAIKRVIRNSFESGAGTGVLRVRMLGNLQELEDILSKASDPSLAIIRSGERTVEVRVKKK